MEKDERTSSIEPAGVMAMACRHRRPDATRETPAVIAVAINGQLARDRQSLKWLEFEEPTEKGKKPFEWTLWYSDTYVRTPKGWRYVFGQASLPLPKTSQTAKK